MLVGFEQGWTQPDGGKLGLLGLQFDLFPTVMFSTEGCTRFGDDIASDKLLPHIHRARHGDDDTRESHL
jgi:hypothetical protein